MALASSKLVHYFRNTWTARILLATALLTTCTPNDPSPIERAEFGVLFGGQVQERSEIPFELDVSKQALGFVIRLSQPLAKSVALHWEVSKPGPLPASRVADPISRRVELFDATAAAGQTQIQKSVSLEPGDSLGLWNIRVTLGEHLAIDRAFMVVDPGSRRRKAREPSVIDAGL